MKITSSKKQISDEHQHHEELVSGLREQLEPILDSSEQPIMIYLDDNHKACNKKFASLLGFSSPKNFSETDANFVETFVDEGSQDLVVSNYHAIMVKKLSASVITAKFKKKDGSKFKATMIHVPITFNGHFFALSFISEVK